jgi:hypothetical protein
MKSSLLTIVSLLFTLTLINQIKRSQSASVGNLINSRIERSNVDPTANRAPSQCQHFQFACRHSGECIAIYNVCDGIPQCPDGSDEAADLNCPDSSSPQMVQPEKSPPNPLPSGTRRNQSALSTMHSLFDHQPHSLPVGNSQLQYPKMPDLAQMENMLQQQMQPQNYLNSFVPQTFQPNMISRFDMNWPPPSNAANSNYAYPMANLETNPWSMYAKPNPMVGDGKANADPNMIMPNYWSPPNGLSDPIEQRRRYLQNLSQLNYLHQMRSQENRLTPPVNAPSATINGESNVESAKVASNYPTPLPNAGGSEQQLAQYQASTLSSSAKPTIESRRVTDRLPSKLKSNNLVSPVASDAFSLGKGLRRTFDIDWKLVTYDFSDSANRLKQQTKEDEEKANESSSAVIALIIGLMVTSVLLFAVAYRMRSIHRRLVRGNAFNLSADSDYLVNGLYV